MECNALNGTHVEDVEDGSKYIYLLQAVLSRSGGGGKIRQK